MVLVAFSNTAIYSDAAASVLGLLCLFVFYSAAQRLDSGIFIHLITQSKRRPLTTANVASHPKMQHKVICWSLPKVRGGFVLLDQRREEHVGPS